MVGKKIRTTLVNRSFEIIIPGKYTIESTQPVLIDDITYAPNQTITLDAGTHNIRVEKTRHRKKIHLRWGENLPKPQLSNPRTSLFMKRFHPLRPKKEES